MVTGDEKWITYDDIVRKRSWSKCCEVAQKVAKPGLTSRKSGPELMSNHTSHTSNFLHPPMIRFRVRSSKCRLQNYQWDTYPTESASGRCLNG
ncbi:hypothetical protein TNCV_1161561 [Trichonephila clavipes]|nr:hypothetical protein TNCV_1161561 [Trichonephila clavipes]